MTIGDYTTGSTKTGHGKYLFTDGSGNILSETDPWGTCTLGRVNTKAWSGADQPKAEKLGPRVIMRHYTSYNQFGVRYHGKIYAPRAKPAKKVAKIPHDYVVAWSSVDHGECDVHAHYQNAGYNISKTGMSATFYYGGVPYLPYPTWTSNDDIALINQLVENIRGGSFNLAVTIGEASQSFKMITEAATRLAQAYTLVKKHKFRQARQVLIGQRKGRFRMDVSPRKSLADNWLQMSWGWLPLVNDIYNGAQMVANHLHRPRSTRFSARRKISTTDALYKEMRDMGSFYPTGGEAIVRKQIVAYIVEGSVPVYTGLGDPELVLWELTPFSCLLDYLIPIGNYLSARAACNTIGGTFVITKTTKRSCNGISKRDADLGYEKISYSLPGAFFNASEGSMTRTITHQLDVPLPSVKTMAQAGTFIHCVNALAMLTTLLTPHR